MNVCTSGGSPITGLAMWLVLACLSSAGAQGSDAPEPASDVDIQSFKEQTERGRDLLVRGDPAAAMAPLEGLRDRLDAGEAVPTELAHEALVYLGDAQFLRDLKADARETFRRILLENPAYVISPYHHTEDVRAYFALVREAVEKERARLPPPPPPPIPRTPALPVWGYAPLGVPQLVQGKSVRGVAYGALQTGFLAGSVGTFLWLQRVNRDAVGHPSGWTEEEIQRRVPQIRYGVQVPLTVAFYATWALSAADGGVTWARRDHGVRSVTLGVGPRGAVLGARF